MKGGDWTTRFELTLVSDHGGGHEECHKTVPGAVLPTPQCDANLMIVAGAITAEVQSVAINVDSRTVIVRSRYVAYSELNEMSEAIGSLRTNGWT